MIGIRISLQLWCRFLQRWRPRLYRERAIVALLAVLMLGVFEPLACVLHCALWMPLHMQSSALAQAQLQHRHHHATTQPDSDSPAASILLFDQMLGHEQMSYSGMVRQSDHHCSSDHAPLAQPFHEMVLSAVALMPLLLILRSVAPSAHTPSSPFLLPRLRPPIA